MKEQISIITDKISKEELSKIAAERFGDMVKAVVDIEKRIMAIGGDMHADEESLLLENGSKQDNLWGINLYPEKQPPEMIEFDSMINIRPRQNNRSRLVEDLSIQQGIKEIISQLIAE